ncbi:fimbrial protein FimV [Acinetobacter bouvetii]|uniref:Fimbrial protein FimV n=1 Tax=Acinetobacter bouvetii TaxID=202951 RepID=A0A811G678_9GAMM|nr:fimbrial protein FimV [Acinetobacter bouvetii]CAB1208439.1 hypothetical protein SFB21_0410 [Acinetobacter bouvetii]
MLIYVIPLVILIIVLVVVKKRQGNQESGKTTTAKSKAQKASSTKKTAARTKEVADTVIEKKKTTPLSDEQRNKIESLIRDHNFFSAEAQINQALNKDNSQHELYLLLLDIHILQKDEFAISQLINHLRSLELDDFLEQALAKKQAHDKEIAGSRDAIDFKMESAVAPTSEPVVAETQNTADFDALMNNAVAPAATTNDLAFDQLQQDHSAPQSATIEEIKPLDFNTLSLDSVTPASTPAEEIKPLDFSNFHLDQAPVEETKVEAAPVQEIQPLDFSFSLDSAKPEQPAPVAEPTTDYTTAETEEKPEFNFDFSVAKTTPETEAHVAVENTKPALDLDFNLEPAIPTDETTAETPAAKASGVSFDISNVSSSAAKIDNNDPLVQSFPELTEVDEIHLNLELAQQYIQLGAYESARELLAEQETKYTSEQKQQADQLLNQIAS